MSSQDAPSFALFEPPSYKGLVTLFSIIFVSASACMHMKIWVFAIFYEGLN